MTRIKKYPATLLIFLMLSISDCGYFQNEKAGLRWLHLESGLSLGTYTDSKSAGKDEASIYILRIDPQVFDINLYCASQFDLQSLSMEGWAEKFDLIAVTNAGMFATDLLTSVGYLNSNGHLNNPKINSSYKCIFACQSLDSAVAAATILDLTCVDFQKYQDKYHSFLQSIRMISCRGKNVWQPQDDRWSIAALGTDSKEQLLFLYSGFPRSVHEFIETLLNLPLDIGTTMYLEGGIQAGIYLSTGGITLDLPGENPSEILLNSDTQTGRPLPNIIGVRRKAE
jgi:hypothetical protein